MDPPTHSDSTVQHQIQWKKELVKSKRQLAAERDHRQNGETIEHQPLGWKPETSNCKGLKHLILQDPISWLLAAFPFAVASYVREWNNVLCFWLNFVVMIPLAKLMGDATEELAAGLKNETVGGLLNATFGNAVEMILTIQTLRAGQIEVVKSTLMGSVLSNLLLVLGMSFFAGGMTPRDGKLLGKQQTFCARSGQVNVTMLLLSAAAVTLPTLFFNAVQEHQQNQRTLQVSRWCSLYILSAYLAYLFFQLYTHAEVFQPQGEDEEEEQAAAEEALPAEEAQPAAAPEAAQIEAPDAKKKGKKKPAQKGDKAAPEAARAEETAAAVAPAATAREAVAAPAVAEPEPAPAKKPPSVKKEKKPTAALGKNKFAMLMGGDSDDEDDD
mmetsp:Transcript_148244/g.412858  ORF Transcript_148244/g.412858 Transcript_148244/m.412858 type:complete len:384 (-) Transcript_148244:138-1289(-)